MTGTLVIGPAWIGDMVLAHSLFQVLKRSAPGRRLAVAAPPWTLPLLRFMPEVDAAIALPFAHGELRQGAGGRGLDQVWLADGAGGWRLGAKVHQRGATSRAVPRLHVVQNVPDHPRTRQVDAVRGRRRQQHARLRLAAGAGDGQAGHRACRVMGAILDGRKFNIPGPQHLPQVAVHGIQRGLGEQAARQS